MSDPFPNDWKSVKSTPLKSFAAIPFEDVHQRAVGWHLPQPWELVVRVSNPETGKVVEKAFRTECGANCFIEQAADLGYDYTFYNEEGMSTTYNSKLEA